jgi:uncharacterized protein involved in exopolysaccharide biosynthesis
VALSEKHRSSIYLTLAPMLGEEEAEALLSQFPARELDEPVTKEFVRAEIAGVRAEIAGVRTEMAEMKAELSGDIAGLRTELSGDIAGLRTELEGSIAGLRTELEGSIAGLRTELEGSIAGLRTELYDRLRQQTMWMAGALVAGMGVASGIASVIP